MVYLLIRYPPFQQSILKVTLSLSNSHHPSTRTTPYNRLHCLVSDMQRWLHILYICLHVYWNGDPTGQACLPWSVKETIILAIISLIKQTFVLNIAKWFNHCVNMLMHMY